MINVRIQLSEKMRLCCPVKPEILTQVMELLGPPDTQDLLSMGLQDSGLSVAVAAMEGRLSGTLVELSQQWELLREYNNSSSETISNTGAIRYTEVDT
jgi:hypothetical protein